jgi:hypothetical protein
MQRSYYQLQQTQKRDMLVPQGGFKMALISNWSKAYTFFSVQSNAIGAALATTYAMMYPQLKDTLPPQYMAGLTAFVFVTGIVCRVINQDKKDGV